jgi:predicted amidohydrolase YtcJ
MSSMPGTSLVFRNARVITMDPALPLARVIAVNGDRISYVGDDFADVAGPATRVIDCEGRTVIPGFNDSHCHIFSFIRSQLTVHLGPPAVKSITDIKEAIRQRARSTPTGEWVNGSDYSDFHLDEKRHPTRWDLDEATTDHPVVISHRSLHACVLNSRALELAGIRIDTPEPPGASIHRDNSTGEPDGILFDMLGYIRYKVMPPLAGIALEEAVAVANRSFLSQGITSLQDATVTNDVGRWKSYTRFKEKGTLKSRVYMMTGIDQLQRFREAGLHFRAGDNSLRMGGLKIVLGETTGQMFPSQADLEQQVLQVHREGGQVAIHAVEPATVEAAVKAIENAVAASPSPHRHRIEHCAECPPPLFERIRQLKPVISTQPPFLHYSGERYLARIAPEAIRWLYRTRSFLDAGLTVVGGSDTPVAPNNPLVGIQAAVTRKTSAGQTLTPEERVTPMQALRLYTSSAARASFDEDVKGSITRGKLADLVLLSDNPTVVDTAAIKDIKVLMTIIGGEVVWG